MRACQSRPEVVRSDGDTTEFQFRPKPPGIGPWTLILVPLIVAPAQEMPLTLISRFSTFPDNASQNAPTVGKPPMPAPASARWVAVHASRVRTRRQVRAMRAAASTTKMPVSMPWKAQNLVAGW
jgi:hypothetical protein